MKYNITWCARQKLETEIMKTYFSPTQLLHDPKEEFVTGKLISAMEIPRRAASVTEAIEAASLGPILPPDDYGDDPLLRVHDPGLIEFLRNLHCAWHAQYPGSSPFPETSIARGMQNVAPRSLRGKLSYYCFDNGTPVLEHTWPAVRAAAHSALAAIRALAHGERETFALCRPPGHHAGRDFYGGYCFLNNAAIAAQDWVERTGEKCAILDVDYHHGNGTQEIFYSRDDVYFASIHADPSVAFPFFSGYSDEKGAGRGLGSNLNIPLPLGTAWAEYQSALAQALDAIVKFHPSALLVSLGVDTYAGDPISHFKLSTSDFHAMGCMIRQLSLPTAAVMEGGYATEQLGQNVVRFLTGLSGGR